MHNCNDFLKTIKKAAVDAVEASKPVIICYGKVQSINPLKITVEQKTVLGEAQLVLTRNVTDHVTKITAKDIPFQNTVIQLDKQEVTIYNGLQIGEGVILIRLQGGQKYMILDRVVTV